MAHPRRMPTSSSTVYRIPFLPPPPFMLRLVGKSNFNLWLTSIKPFLFCHPAITGLILGGWPEPVADRHGPAQGSRGKVRLEKSIRGAFNCHVPSTSIVSSTAHIDNWNYANHRVCQFIRGTLGPSVLSFVSHHYTARTLWLYLDWLYGETSGIDTLIGAPIPVWTEDEEEMRQESTGALGVASRHGLMAGRTDEKSNPKELEMMEDDDADMALDGKSVTNKVTMLPDDDAIENTGLATSSPQSHNDTSSSNSCTHPTGELQQEQSTPLSTAATASWRTLVRTPLASSTAPPLLSLNTTVPTLEDSHKPVSRLVQPSMHPAASQHKSCLAAQLDDGQVFALPRTTGLRTLSSQPRSQVSWDRNLDTIAEESHAIRRVELSKKRFGMVAARAAKDPASRRSRGGGISDRSSPDDAKSPPSLDHRVEVSCGLLHPLAIMRCPFCHNSDHKLQ